MSIDFVSRMVGMVIFALVGARIGADSAGVLSLPEFAVSFILGLVGILFGLIMTPWITIRPVRALSRAISAMTVEALFTTIIGLGVGLLIGLLAAYPLSLVPGWIGLHAPALVMLVAVYLTVTIFNRRSLEVLAFITETLAGRVPRGLPTLSGDGSRYLLDTSVLIDGRVVDIARAGFLVGTLLAPRFVIAELHRVADSSDAQRRARGKRGLNILNELQRDPTIAFKVIEDDIEEIAEVDDKLVALAAKLNASIITIDYPLNQVAKVHGTNVLNINALANAVRSVYIPGETFAIRIIQEGNQGNQGVGYLDDGTMVVVENGKPFIDRTIYVEATKLITKDTGRIIFAVPNDGKPRPKVVTE